MSIERILFYLLILFLPTQLGKHFWPDFSIVSGIRIDYLSPTVYVTDILIGILFVFWFLNRHSGEQSDSRTRSVTRVKDSGRTVFARMTKGKSIYIIFCLFLVLNIYLSQNYLNGFYHLLKFLEFSFVAYYVATTVIRVEQVKKIFLILGIGVIGQSVLVISQFINQGSLGNIFYFIGERAVTASTPGIANASLNGELLLRPYGTFSHPNVLAGFLLMSMVSLLFTFFWTKRFTRPVWLVALLLGSSALLLTMSRVAFIIWFLFLMTVFLQQIIKQYRKPFLAVVYLVIMIALVMITPFSSRILQTNLSEEAFVQRVELTKASISLIATQPLIGVGFGNFLPQLATIATPLPLNLYLQPVHNIFLLVLAETGIIGFGAFFWFLVVTYKRLFRLVHSSVELPYRIFLVLLSLVLLLGLFDHYFLTLQQGQLVFALIIGLCWVRLSTSRQD